MRILHLTPFYTPAYAFGGVTRAVDGLTRALARRGNEVTVLTTDALDQQTRLSAPLEETIEGVRVIRVRNLSTWLRGRLNVSTPNGMRAVASSIMKDIDILHVHEFRTVENLLVTPVAANHGIPTVLSPHGTLIQSTGRSILKATWDKILSPAIVQRIDHVIALAQTELDDIQALWHTFGRRPIPTGFSIIPNGIDLHTFTTLPDASSIRERYGLGDSTVVLFMGRLHQRKGIEVLVEAFKQAAIPDSKLLIVGPDEGMQARVEELKTDDVILTGYLGGDDRLSTIASGDIFALPSVGEGLSMAVLEAMAAGIPAILSPGCNFPQASEQGAGVIVEPQLEPLTDALRDLLTDSDKRHRMGQAARALVESEFTWDKVAERLETEVYSRYVT